MTARVADVRRYLLSGVSYAIPFVACGGIMIAGAIAFVPMTASGPDFSHSPFLKTVFDIGNVLFPLNLLTFAGGKFLEIDLLHTNGESLWHSEPPYQN